MFLASESSKERIVEFIYKYCNDWGYDYCDYDTLKENMDDLGIKSIDTLKKYILGRYENGKLVIPVGDRFSQILQIMTKQDNRIETKTSCHCVFVKLIGKNGWSN